MTTSRQEKLQQHLNRLRHNITQIDYNKQGAGGALKNAEEAFYDVQTEHASLKSLYIARGKTIEEMQAAINNYVAEINRLNQPGKVGDLEKANQVHERSIERLQAVIQDYKNDIDRYLLEIQRLHQIPADAELLAHNADLKAENGRVTENYQDAVSRQDAAAARNIELRERLDMAVDSLAACRSAKEELSNELTATKESLLITAQQRDEARAKASKVEIRKELDEARMRIASLGSELTWGNSREAAAKAEVAKLRGELHERKNHTDNLRVEIRKEQDAAEAYRLANNELTNRLNSRENDLQVSDERKEYLQGKLAEARNKYEDEAKTVAILRDEIERLSQATLRNPTVAQSRLEEMEKLLSDCTETLSYVMKGVDYLPSYTSTKELKIAIEKTLKRK